MPRCEEVGVNAEPPATINVVNAYMRKLDLSLVKMESRYRSPPRLARARTHVGLLLGRLVNRYMMSVKTVRLQRGFDKTFRNMAESPTWQALCSQVFDLYLGQFSFTPLTQIHFLAEKLNITSQTHVLELAPGTGGLSLYLANLTGCRLTGQDASPLAAKIANRQAISQGLAKRVHFHVGILPELPYKEGSFDVVISIDSVYGIADKTALFRGCYRVLKAGGHLGFYTLYRRREFSAESAMHARASYWFPLQPYSKLLEETGFKDILKTDLTEDFIRLAKQWVKAMQENKMSLDKELGRKTRKSLLADIGTALVLGIEGYIGRAFFEAKKPFIRGSV